MALKQDIGLACLNCTKCTGFKIHGWRKICTECQCSVEQHDISDESALSVIDELKLSDKGYYNNYQEAMNLAEKIDKNWLPIGLKYNEINEFSGVFGETMEKVDGERSRKKKIRLQIPVQDRCVEKFCHLDTTLERQEAEKFLTHRNRDIGLGYVMRLEENMICVECQESIECNSLCISSDQCHGNNNNGTSNHNSSPTLHSNQTPKLVWHPNCFKCTVCHEILVDFIHTIAQNNKLYCVRHHAQTVRPRCTACDELIFALEFVRDGANDYHVKHFACALCDQSLARSRYLELSLTANSGDSERVRPVCATCYDSKLANRCSSCSNIIGAETKDINYRQQHWHSSCFKCSECNISLEGRQFGLNSGNNGISTPDRLLCETCHTELVVPKCEGCGRPTEYDRKIVMLGEKNWHYDCFVCEHCNQSIGSECFIQHSNKRLCSNCYEKSYAKICHKCNKIIKESGVAYKDHNYHYDCFTCHNCNAKLSDVKFSVRDNKLYCKSCVEELFANKCSKCCRLIVGESSLKYVKFDDRCWHSACFNCSKCSISLVNKGFLTKEKDILCSQCGT